MGLGWLVETTGDCGTAVAEADVLEPFFALVVLRFGLLSWALFPAGLLLLFLVVLVGVGLTIGTLGLTSAGVGGPKIFLAKSILSCCCFVS